MRRRQVVTIAAGCGLGVAQVVLTAKNAPWRVRRWTLTPPMALAFAAALAERPRTATTRLVTAALGLSAVGDAFLTDSTPARDEAATLAGIGAFAAAYATLTAAFWRGRPQLREAWIAVASAGTAAAVATTVLPHATGVMRGGVPVFGAVIASMAWAAESTALRGTIDPRVARWAVPMAPLLLLSDSLVALLLFHPRFKPAPVAADIVVRATYLAGWVLMLLLVQEEGRCDNGSWTSSSSPR